MVPFSEFFFALASICVYEEIKIFANAERAVCNWSFSMEDYSFWPPKVLRDTFLNQGSLGKPQKKFLQEWSDH